MRCNMYTSPTFLPPTTPWPLLFFLSFSFLYYLPSAIFIALMLVGPSRCMPETIIQIKLNRVKNPNWREANCKHDQGFVALSIQPKISKFLVSMLSNGKDHFGLIRPEYSRPALMMVLFDRFSHFSRLDQNVPSHLRK